MKLSLNAPQTERVQLALLLLSLTPSIAMAATDGAADPFWNGILSVVVLATAAGSAALPVSAYRYWTGYWKLVAAIPMLMLTGWTGLIVISRLLQPGAHAYWQLEIFAWAMLTMLYMATVMTAKRQFEKADNQKIQ